MRLPKLLGLCLVLFSLIFSFSSFTFNTQRIQVNKMSVLTDLPLLTSEKIQVFVIKKVGTKYSLQTLNASLNEADFCGAFYTSKRNVLTFDDGSVVELKSKTELIKEGAMMSDNCFLQDNVEFNSCIWTITPDGFLLKGHPHALEKNQVIKN